jgi:RNAse (barnase) inhibitor barstar
MAIFIEDSHFLNGRLDWEILQNGWSSLYCSAAILESDLNWFRKSDFMIIEIDCSNWTNLNSMHRSLSTAFSFPDYYGNNLDSLNDCLSDVEIPDEGLIVVFKHFEIVQRDVGVKIADIFANNSRRHILFGRKLILLIQVSSRDFEMPNVGGSPILWNSAEFFNTK